MGTYGGFVQAKRNDKPSITADPYIRIYVVQQRVAIAAILLTNCAGMGEAMKRAEAMAMNRYPIAEGWTEHQWDVVGGS